jgi:hypothetical protein
MVSTWWHPPIARKVLWRKLPWEWEQRKSNCFKKEGMPISINIIACLECSCHIWVPQLVYFDKIHHNFFYTFPFFSNAQSDSFDGVGSHITNRRENANACADKNIQLHAEEGKSRTRYQRICYWYFWWCAANEVSTKSLFPKIDSCWVDHHRCAQPRTFWSVPCIHITFPVK